MDIFAQVNRKNIIHSDSWWDSEYLSFFQERLNDMRSKKAPFVDLFKQYETQYTSLSYYDNQWMLQVNIPLEENLVEVYMWRTNGKISYDVLPQWQANVDELQPAKYALQFFLDWNEKDNFWKQNKSFRINKVIYWTWIYYTWLRSYKDIRYKLKEWKEIQSWTDLLNKKNLEKVENETWFFFPKSIHPMDFYPDDKAYWQNDIQNAEDCIFKEKVTYAELLMRYWDNKAFENFDKLTTSNDTEPKNVNDNSIQQDEIILHYYFHRIYKTMLVVANETILLYNWVYLYNDWKLPFVLWWHYNDPNCIWQKWIPAKIGYIKGYKSEILMDILVWASMSSWINLISWNDDITQDWSVWGRWVNIWKTTWWAERVQQVNTSPNLWYFTTVLNLLDDLVIQDTWDNLRSPVDAWSDKLWIVEIMEARKEVRQSAVDENYNIALDEALTMTLQLIKDFASSLLSEKIKDESWKVIKTIFPKITIKDFTVEKEDWKQVFTENIWKFWYFELEDDTVQWWWVKITTSSTNSMLPILERQKVTEYINNLMSLWQLAQFNPEIAQKLSEKLNIDDLMGWVWDAYWYDNKLKANTEKDKINEKIKKKTLELTEMFKTNPTPNEDTWENPTSTIQNQELWWTMGEIPTTWAGLNNSSNPLTAM